MSENEYNDNYYQKTGENDGNTTNQYENSYRNQYGYYNAQGSNKDLKKKSKKNSWLKVIGVCAAFGIFFGVFAGVSFFAVKSFNTLVQDKKEALVNSEDVVQEPEKEKSDSIAESNGIESAKNNNVTAVVTDVTGVVENVMPSVVSVTNNFITRQQDFFGQIRESEQSASGSGIIVGQNDTELLLVTNYHVVEGTDKLSVQFIDGTEAEAQLKGSDSGMDLAVMAVQLENLSEDTKKAIVIAKLGDSESLKVGEPAIAIGNALGYGQSVTTGVISAVNRSIVDTTSEKTPTGTGSQSGTSLIQTDAAINPGNSGGALLNINGEVVGINSNKIGGSVVEGMGYAIPISSAKPIIEELMTKSTKMKVTEGEKAYLGISGVDVSSDAAATYGLPEGVYIAQVYPDTAASKAGLVKGDIITKFDGSSVNSMEELQSMLSYFTAGSEVEVTIQQGSPSGYQEKNISITLGPKPEQMVQ